MAQIYIPGIFARSKLSAEECAFELNDFGEATSGAGGAIYTGNVDVDLNKCSFKKNKAVGNGGALLFVVNDGISHQLSVSDSDFEKNQAANWAGAIEVSAIRTPEGSPLAVTLNRVRIAGNTQEGRLSTEAGAGLSLNIVTTNGIINANLIGCSFSGNFAPDEDPSDLWYDSVTTAVNVFSTCAEGHFAEGKGVLACYESDGTSVNPCDPALTADLSGTWCEECGESTYSCCGASECTDSEPICNEVFHELTCPSSEDNNDKRYSKKGHLRAIEPPSVFAGNTRAS
mmetsp:Transcript_81030/g.161586  ORF Transcript_81030/g.161586 Transcript_81030/m.161586 type:complete len:286 (-) Transcript_81030:214-1071(-)